MLLAVDIGNTNIKFGVFDAERLVFKISIPTLRNVTAVGLANVLRDRLTQDINSSIICSVVHDVDPAIRDFVENGYGMTPLFVSNDADFGLKINYEPLSSLGTDRLVNAFAAVEKYGIPCTVCSFGTATTIDVVSAEGVFLGGVIAPGMETMAKALDLSAAQLPQVEIKKPARVLGNTTAASIQSGIVYGHIAMIEGVIQRIKNEMSDIPKVIATGGFASLIAENTDQIDVVDENLMLDGLRLLHGRIQPA